MVFCKWFVSVLTVVLTETWASSQKAPHEWINKPAYWGRGWYRVEHPQAPVKRWGFNEGSGERLVNIPRDGWDPEWDFDQKLGPLRKRVGLDQVMGSSSESTRTASRSTYGFTTVVDEQMKSNLYCLGARDRRIFFGPVANRYKYTESNNNCIESCYGFATLNDSDANRFALAEQGWLSDCRVPLTHVMKAQVMGSVTSGGPTASIRLPKTALKNTQINHRDNLVNVLMRVKLINPPLRVDYKPFSSKVVTDWKSERVENNWKVHFTAGRGIGRDNRLSKHDFGLLKSISPENRFRVSGLRRTKDKATGSFDFRNDSMFMTPKFRAAPSIHYAAYEATSFKMTGNTGTFIDELDVVEVFDRNWVAVDVTPIIKRLWATDHFEFALLSTSDIIDVDPEFIFHRAVQWTYKVESPKAASLMNETACNRAGFTWCKKVVEDSDYFDLDWNKAVGVHKFGRCGVPKDACYLINMNIFGG